MKDKTREVRDEDFAGWPIDSQDVVGGGGEQARDLPQGTAATVDDRQPFEFMPVMLVRREFRQVAAPGQNSLTDQGLDEVQTLQAGQTDQQVLVVRPALQNAIGRSAPVRSLQVNTAQSGQGPGRRRQSLQLQVTAQPVGTGHDGNGHQRFVSRARHAMFPARGRRRAIRPAEPWPAVLCCAAGCAPCRSAGRPFSARRWSLLP